jgi:hypothetical protein
MYHPEHNPVAAALAVRQQELDRLLLQRRQAQAAMRTPVRGYGRGTESPTPTRVTHSRIANENTRRTQSPVCSWRTAAATFSPGTNRRPRVSDILNRSTGNANGVVRSSTPPFRSMTPRGQHTTPRGTRRPAQPRFEVDIDRMSYEDLLALQDSIGFVKVGVPSDLLALFPVWRPTGVVECSVCLETSATQPGDFRCLPCKHRFHRDCIDPWLQQSKYCPVCKQDVTELSAAIRTYMPRAASTQA